MRPNTMMACLMVGVASTHTMTVANEPPPISLYIPQEKTPNVSPMPPVEINIKNTPTGTLELGSGMTGQINQAIVSRNWQHLKQLLDDYPSSKEYDPLLYRYALGAWYRSTLRHARAIGLYRQILADDPSFDYVRFDLAVMLFEDKQYKEAYDELMAVKPRLNANMQALAQRYLEQIKHRQKADIDVSFNYEISDNVNNASSATQIQWGGRTWQKSADSLPQKATGIRYGVDITKDISLQTNHYLTAHASIKGVHYWDNPKYDEQTALVSMGYKHQNVLGNVSVMPFVERTWLDDRAYQRELGLKAGLNRRMNARLHLGAGVQYAKRHYDDERLSQRHDANISRIHVSHRYALTPQTVFFGGADITREKAKDKEQSSVRHGVNLGVLGETKAGLGGRVSVRYVKRHFDAPEGLVYGFVRQDDEYYLQSAVWHNKWQYKGFMPTFNVSYRKIDSNMDALYSRDGVQYFVSVEKRF